MIGHIRYQISAITNVGLLTKKQLSFGMNFLQITINNFLTPAAGDLKITQMAVQEPFCPPFSCRSVDDAPRTQWRRIAGVGCQGLNGEDYPWGTGSKRRILQKSRFQVGGESRARHISGESPTILPS